MNSQNLPDGWRKVKLGDVCNLLRGTGLSKEKLSGTGKHRCVLYGELYTKYSEIIKEVRSRTDESDGTPSKKGDILIPGSTTTTGIDLANAVALNEDGVLLGGDINILRKTDNSYNSEFLAYYLTHIKKGEIMRITQGITIVHVYGKNLKKIDLLLPPRDLQDKLADIIKTIDEAIEQTDKIIKESEKVKKGLLRKLLSHNSNYLRECKLKEVVSKFKNGGTPSTKEKDYWKGNIPWITGVDFLNGKLRKIRRQITIEAVKNSATNIIEKGNLLLVTRTGVGKMAIAPFDVAISQDITGVIFKEDIIPEYGYWFLTANTLKIQALNQGTSINGIIRNDLENFMITVPSHFEQKRIIDILDNVDKRIDIELIKNKKLGKTKKALMQKLLTGQIRVKVD